MRRTTQLTTLAGLVAAAIAVLPASAAAITTANPTNLNFGDQQLGTTSLAKVTMLTATCTTFVGPPVGACTTIAGDTLLVDIGTTGDFVATSDCPPGLAPNPTTGAAASCTVSVTFAPTQTGARTGTLTTGEGVDPGPAVALSGTGTAPPDGGAGGGTGGATPAGGQSVGSGEVAGKAKQCKRGKKKKKGAAAAKKKSCKRKKR